jgi:hypothetical protein
MLLSILCVSVPTILIGALPTYEQAGVAAPVLMAIMRLVQGLAVGGEVRCGMHRSKRICHVACESDGVTGTMPPRAPWRNQCDSYMLCCARLSSTMHYSLAFPLLCAVWICSCVYVRAGACRLHTHTRTLHLTACSEPLFLQALHLS